MTDTYLPRAAALTKADWCAQPVTEEELFERTALWPAPSAAAHGQISASSRQQLNKRLVVKLRVMRVSVV